MNQNRLLLRRRKVKVVHSFHAHRGNVFHTQSVQLIPNIHTDSHKVTAHGCCAVVHTFAALSSQHPHRVLMVTRQT